MAELGLAAELGLQESQFRRRTGTPVSWPNRLRESRRYLGESQKAMAARLGIPYRTYQGYENAVSAPSLEVMNRLVELGFNADWLLRGTGPMRRPEGDESMQIVGVEQRDSAAPAQPEEREPALRGLSEGPQAVIPVHTGRRDLPVLGSAQGGCGGTLIIPVEQRPIDYVFRPPQLEGVVDAFAVFAREDSMEPMYRNGQVLLIHPHLPIRPGDGVLIVKRDDHALVKCLVRRTQTELRVRQFNPAAEFAVSAAKVRSLYRVVGALDLF